jgi:hypothetical protein
MKGRGGKNVPSAILQWKTRDSDVVGPVKKNRYLNPENGNHPERFEDEELENSFYSLNGDDYSLIATNRGELRAFWCQWQSQ